MKECVLFVDDDPSILEAYQRKLQHALTIAEIAGAERAYLKGGSPSCAREGVTGEVLRRAGIKVVKVP